MTGSDGAAAIAGHRFLSRSRRVPPDHDGVEGSCTQIRTSVAGLVGACEQPPMLFCDRKPRCPEAHCFKKLDCVSLDRRVRIFRYAEMNGDFAPSLR